MLNRRILRIKAFKTLYSSVLSAEGSLSAAESRLDQSCEATRDLYLFMLGMVSPLAATAREKIEAARNKINPTDEERNPNMKFAENALAKLLDGDPDFSKALAKRKLSWDNYDIVLKKIYASVIARDYFRAYMENPVPSLEDDCRLFTKIFEQELVDREDLEAILEDLSIYWNDDLAYALTFCCKSLKSIAKTGRWDMLPLYQSDMKKGVAGIESDKQFVHRLLQNAFAGYDKYAGMINESAANWDPERIFSTDRVLIVCGLAELESFPSIPMKVIINEYVEISKFYGTHQSSVFVNGLLDRLGRRIRVAEAGRIDEDSRS